MTLSKTDDVVAAWIVAEWVRGISQKRLGRLLGCSNSSICMRIDRFCRDWHEDFPERWWDRAYIDKRPYAQIALDRYTKQGGTVKPPASTLSLMSYRQRQRLERLMAANRGRVIDMGGQSGVWHTWTPEMQAREFGL